MSSLLVQRDVAALFYAVIGKKADIKDIDYFSKKLAQENLSLAALTNKLINSELGQSRLSQLNNSEKIQFIYHNLHGADASEEILAYLLSQLEKSGDLGSLAAYMNNELLHYSGQEVILKEQQSALIETVNQTLFPSFNGSVSDGAEWVQGFYYAVKSTMTSDGINYWGNVINKHPEQLNLIAQKFVDGKKTLSNLSDNDFVIKIYENIFGSAPDNNQLQKYTAGLTINTENRGDVIVRMINDIRNDDTSEHADAKAIFLANTHVYAAGELPAPVYQEAITAIWAIRVWQPAKALIRWYSTTVPLITWSPLTITKTAVRKMHHGLKATTLPSVISTGSGSFPRVAARLSISSAAYP